MPRVPTKLLGLGLRLVLLGVVAVGAGCLPLSPLVPFHMTETTEVLGRGKFSFNATAGGGGLSGEGSGSGVALRVRAGVGARQEIGIEGGVVYISTGPVYIPPNNVQRAPWSGGGSALGAKVTWKMAPLPWLAVIAGAGGSSSDTGAAAGGDLALLVSPGSPLSGMWRPYLGVRGLFAIPVGRDIDVAGGPTAGMVVPLGLALHANRWIRVFFEAGPIVAFSNLGTAPERAGQPESNPYPGVYAAGTHAGGYGVIGVTLLLGRNKDQKWFLEAQQIWMR